MSEALHGLCREINDWHPKRLIIPTNMIPIIGWVKSAPEAQPKQVSFLRVGLLVNGVVMEPRIGVEIKRTKRLLATALNINAAHFWLLPRHRDEYTEHTWDTFAVEWEFVLIPTHRLVSVANNLTLCRTSFFAEDQIDSIVLIPLRSVL